MKNTPLKLVLLIIAVVLAACSEPDKGPIESPRSVLTTVIGNISKDTKSKFAGELRAIDRASLSFEIGGVVTDINVELGGSFEKDEILGRVDQTQAKLALDARKAELLDAQASQQEAQLEFKRRSSLRGTGAVSVASIEQAESRLESSQARLIAAKSAVASAEKQLSDTILLAPFSGEVVNRLAEPSQVVNPGQSILEVVGVDAGLEGVVDVPGYVRQSVNVGDTVQARILSSSITIAAEITEIGNRANAAGLFPIILQLNGETKNASSGQSIEVAFDAASSQDGSWIIPTTAYTVGSAGQVYAFVINEAESEKATSVKRIQINVDQISSAGVLVTSGLNFGDVIVIKGVDLLSDGQMVVPIDQDSNRFGGK